MYSDSTGTDNNAELSKIEGTIFSANSGEIITQDVYFFLDDNFVPHTCDSGSYSIDSVSEGAHYLLCSSINFSDKTILINTKENSAKQDYYLETSTSRGRIRGEFQDVTLFNQRLEEDSTLIDPSEKEIFNGITGASLQEKSLMPRFLPEKYFGEIVLLLHRMVSGNIGRICKLVLISFEVLARDIKK